MTEARIPTPRQIALTPVVRQPSGATLIGQALQDIGQAGQQFVARRQAADEQVKEIDHRIAMDEQKRQDDARYIEEAQRWVQTEAETEAAVATLRQQAGPFARGHDEAVRKLLEERYRAFDESLADNPRVRERLVLTIAQSAAQIDAREQAWQRDSAFKAQGEAVQATAETRRNQLARAKPEDIGTMLGQFLQERDQILAAGTLNADQQTVAARAYGTLLAQGAIEGAFNAGKPDVVQTWIDSGQLDGLDLDVAKVRDQVAGERRALDIAAERAQAEELAKARAAADKLQAEIKVGINPTQEEFAAVNAGLKAAGAPEAELVEFGALSIQMGLNRQYSEAADPDGIKAGQAAAGLRAKVAAGTATKAEQVAAAHLGDVADARAKAAGARRKELAGQGVQGQLVVLTELDRMPPEQRFIAAQEAKDGLGYVSQLAPTARQFALAGRDARKARPEDFGSADDVRAAFSKNVGDFAGYLGGSYEGIMNLAWDLYAGGISSEGGKGWDAKRFRQSVHVAFGANRRADGTAQGGLGTFNGAVILPTYQTADEFERSVRSLTFAGAAYANGAPANREDVLGSYRPEYWRDDEQGRALYRMIDASGKPLMQANQRDFYRFVAPRKPRGR